MIETQPAPRFLAAKAIAVGLVALLVVPFFVTLLYRNDLGDRAVAAICLVIGVGLLARRGLPRAAGVGWLTGFVLYAAFLFWLLTTMSTLPD